MKFEINTKSLFLTFPQSKLDIDTVLSELSCKLDIQYGIACTEKHKEGGYHFHVGLQLERSFRTRNNAFFDIRGEHPNIQSARQFGAVANYIKKDGEWVEWGQPNAIRNYISLEDVGEYGSELEWLEACRKEKIPGSYATAAWKAKEALPRSILLEKPKVVGPWSLVQTKIRDLIQSARMGSIIVEGPAGVGKTTAVLDAIEYPAVWASHMDDLKGEMNEIKTVVFDDMDFKHLPRTSQIHLVDTEHDRTIHARYRNIFLPKGTKRVFTCNEYPLLFHDESIQRRVLNIECYKLYEG